MFAAAWRLQLLIRSSVCSLFPPVSLARSATDSDLLVTNESTIYSVYAVYCVREPTLVSFVTTDTNPDAHTRSVARVDAVCRGVLL